MSQNSDNDNVYINLISTNIKDSSNIQTPISFNMKFNQNVLNNTTGYKLSIIRFDLNSNSLPVFIPLIDEPTTDLNRTQYSCTFQFQYDVYSPIYSYTQYLIWEPQCISDSPEYYYCYSYSYFANLVSKMFQNCYNGINTIVQTNLTNDINFTYNPTTQIFEIKYDTTSFGLGYNKINIYFNVALEYLLSGYLYTYPNLNNNQYALLNLNTYGIFTQDYSTIAQFSPINSIVFTSSLLPIYSSITPPVQLYKDSSLIDSSSTYNFKSVLTDFSANDLIFQPVLQYNAVIYRWIDLKPNQTIEQLDLYVYWINKFTGIMKPINLTVGSSSSIKILLSNKWF